MARGTNESGTDVSGASEVSGEATPMEEAPASPTDAQVEQGASVDGEAKPSVEQLEQAKKDAEWIRNNPNVPHIRAAVEGQGGEGALPVDLPSDSSEGDTASE